MVRKRGGKKATATVPQPQGLTATPAQEFGTAGIGRNGISNVLKRFGVEECPECKGALDLTDNRLAKEFCGHTRCRRCFIEGTACIQCKESLSVIKSDSQNGSASHGYQLRRKRPAAPQAETPLRSMASASSNSVTIALPSTTVAAAAYKPNHFLATPAKVSKLSNGHSPTATVLPTSPSTRPDNKPNSQNGSVVNEYHQQQHQRCSRKKPAEAETSPAAFAPDLTTLTSAASFPQSSIPVIAANVIAASRSEETAASSSSESKRKRRKKRCPIKIHDHITVISGATTMFQCNVCMKKFKTKAHIKYHEFCQNGEKPFKCEECGQGFVAKSHYEYHLRTHSGERPYPCPKCSKRFNQRGKVTRHMRCHTGEKPFVCTECGRAFANAQALKSHNLIHTGERPHQCKYCNKRFTGMTNLKKHIITHTGERPHACAHCCKSFGLKWTLDLHMRTHSSERPYPCDQCERAFNNSKDLKRHLVIHSGERPFKCWICGIAFRRKDNLNRHIKNTHNLPKEVAKQLANEAAAEYLATNANSSFHSTSKINSSVISKVLRSAQLNVLIPKTRTSKTLKISKPKPKKSRTQPAPPPTTPTSLILPTSNMESSEPEDSFLLACTETGTDLKISEQSRNLIPSDCGIKLLVVIMNNEPSSTKDSSPNLSEVALPEELGGKLKISSNQMDNNTKAHSKIGEIPEFSLYGIFETESSPSLEEKPEFESDNVQANEEPMSTTEENVGVEILETEHSLSLKENPEFECDNVQTNEEPMSTTEENVEIEILETEHSPSQEEKPEFECDNLQTNEEPMLTAEENIEIVSSAGYEENGNFERELIPTKTETVSDGPESTPTYEKETQTVFDEDKDCSKVLIGPARSIHHCNEPSSPVLSAAMDMASSTVTIMKDFEPTAVRSSGEGLESSYETGIASEYTGTAFYPTQLTIDQPNYENMNILYATATAQAEINDDESGPPVKIRLLHAEALGIRRDEPSDPRLYYVATRPNQVIEDYTSANVALAPPVVIHPSETDGATPYVSMYQYGYDQNISISQIPPSQYPVEVSYANGYTHAQQVSDHPDRTELINRAREVRNFLPETHAYAHKWNAPESFEPPIYANHDPQQHQYMPGPMDQYNPNTTTSTTTRYSPLAELAAEASRRLSEANQEKYNATIAAAAAIAMVGEEARKKREQEYRANLNRQCDERIRIARENPLKSAAQRKIYD